MPEEQPPPDKVPTPPAKTPPAESDPPESHSAFTNVAQLLSHHATSRPDSVAIIQPLGERRSLTWAELDAYVNAVASGMARHGLVAGHRVAIQGPNSIEFVVAYFAALRAGFVVVPIDPDEGDDRLRTVLADSAARLVLTADDHDLAGENSLPLTEAGLADLAAQKSGSVISPPDREALAVLLYTAGTSGDPKGVMLTHRALIAHLEHVQAISLVDAETIMVALLPLFHVFGLNAVVGSWVMGGAKLVVVDRFTDATLKVISDEGVTNLPLAPSLLYRMLQYENLADALSTVRMVVSGAAPLPPSLSEDFTERTGLRVEQGYGLTEAAPGVTVTVGSEVAGAGHVGHALPGVEIRIGDGRDETEPAEISVRGDNLFSGYWPDGRGGPAADGWFNTGDIGYLRDGELFLVDRAGELILVSGFHVFPAEIEGVILELAGVEAVAVIGKPSGDTEGDQRGEVVAFVVGHDLTEQQVLAHCASRLARFKQPAEVRLVDELPRGATGKIKKGSLRQLVRSAGTAGQRPREGQS